jgi:predicted amino acid-binding ACT domain protein
MLFRSPKLGISILAAEQSVIRNAKALVLLLGSNRDTADIQQLCYDVLSNMKSTLWQR